MFVALTSISDHNNVILRRLIQQYLERHSHTAYIIVVQICTHIAFHFRDGRDPSETKRQRISTYGGAGPRRLTLGTCRNMSRPRVTGQTTPATAYPIPRLHLTMVATPHAPDRSAAPTRRGGHGRAHRPTTTAPQRKLPLPSTTTSLFGCQCVARATPPPPPRLRLGLL